MRYWEGIFLSGLRGPVHLGLFFRGRCGRPYWKFRMVTWYIFLRIAPESCGAFHALSIGGTLRTFGLIKFFGCIRDIMGLRHLWHFCVISFFWHRAIFESSTRSFCRGFSFLGVTHSRDLLSLMMGPLSWQLGPIHNIIIWDMILCLFCVSGRGGQQETARKSSLVSPSTISNSCSRIELALLVLWTLTPLCYLWDFFR